MNVFLLSVPDYFEHMPPVAVRMPNGALTSIAGSGTPSRNITAEKSRPLDSGRDTRPPPSGL